MSKLTLHLILLILPLAGIAQTQKQQPVEKGFYIKSFGLVGKSTAYHHDIPTHRYGGAEANNAYGYGLEGGYRIGNVHFGTGIQYQEFGWLDYAVSWTPQTGWIDETITKNRIKTVCVPLSIGYYPKWFYFQGYFSAAILTDGDRYVHWDNPETTFQLNNMDNVDGYHFEETIRDNFWVAGISFGTNIPVGKHFKILAGVDGKHTIGSIDADPENRLRSLAVSGQLGVMYHFK